MPPYQFWVSFSKIPVCLFKLFKFSNVELSDTWICSTMVAPKALLLIQLAAATIRNNTTNIYKQVSIWTRQKQLQYTMGWVFTILDIQLAYYWILRKHPYAIGKIWLEDEPQILLLLLPGNIISITSSYFSPLGPTKRSNYIRYNQIGSPWESNYSSIFHFS